MNAKDTSFEIVILLALLCALPVWAGDAKSWVQQGNQAYASGEYLKAVEHYDQALADAPRAVVPLFNKANSYYHMNDLDEAIALYRDVDLKARDLSLVEKARFNLGNCAYQQGLKHRDSDLPKTLELMKNGMSHWRRALEINPDNAKARRNLSAASLMIKDIMDQIKEQQEQQQNDPNQPQDPNQQQQQSPDQQKQDQKEDETQQDPNEEDSKDPQQQEPDQEQEQDPNQSPQPQPDQSQEKEDKIEQDMTAQAILDKEQRQNEERRKRQRSSYQRVDRDW